MALIVNGEKIEDAAIKQEAERMRGHYEEVFAEMSKKEREAQLLEWSRENVMERVLINQEARGNGEPIPKEEIDSALAKLKEQYEDPKELYKDFDVKDDEKVKEQLELQMKVERTIQQVTENAPKPTKAAIQEYYDEHKEQFKSPEQVRIAHIVVYVNWQVDEATAHETITKAHEELKNGALFEAVVDKYTACADSGGDLGYVAKGQMVEEFEDAVFNLDIGEVSGIFRTRFGFHIAKLYDRKPEAIAELKEVKEDIIGRLQEQIRGKAVDDFVDRLKSKAKIEEV